jgi:hypothetical protein
MLRKGMLGPRNPVFIYLLEHPFFFGEKIQRIIQASSAAGPEFVSRAFKLK